MIINAIQTSLSSLISNFDLNFIANSTFSSAKADNEQKKKHRRIFPQPLTEYLHFDQHCSHKMAKDASY